MLEALRKAERQAQGSARSAAAGEREHPAGPSPAPVELGLEPAESFSTRAALEPAGTGAVRDDARPAASATRASARPGVGGSGAHLPFRVALALLGAAALGAIAYFGIALQPAPTNAQNPPRRPVVDAGPAAAPMPVQLAIPGLPDEVRASASSPAEASVAIAAATAASAAPVAVQQAASRPSLDTPATEVAPPARPAEAGVPAQVAAAYAAFQMGDIVAAREAYQRAVDEEPASRDALLGMAAVEMRAQRFGLAEAHYRRLLQIDPENPHAEAGLLALGAERVDPLRAESRLKTLLAANPEATALHFSLGNQFARQGRWADAQQAYLRALAGDEGNPDIAFNLAVSLDQLHQPARAREYYARALGLAERRSAAFPAKAALLRLQQLGR